jgi:hypothetical protein
MLPRLALTFAVATFVPCAAAFAQSSPPESDAVAPAHVAYVDGAVSLEREGRSENAPLNMPLLSGDRLRTADGRVEVLFADGSTLHLDVRTTIDVQSDELVRLIDGRLRLNILGPADAARGAAASVAYRIDSPAGSARITQPGEYRIALLHGNDETQLELAVVRGAGEVFTDQGATPVRAGERAYASAGLAPSYAYAYNSATWDTFDRWSENRRDVRLGVSSQYLPADMQPYSSVLDESGDWRYNQSYGYVWYPRVVADWRPYYYGRWISYPRFGWTWIGADRFSWPTHHFGRWGFSAGVWFWIPGRHWAPAYVAWGYAPGYVSWCPLGFNNRPIIALNFFSVRPGFYSSSRAWTSIAFSNFGRDFVNHRAVNWDRFDRGRRPTFEERRTPPGSSRDVAVARNSTPIRWAGSRDGNTDGSRANTRESRGNTTGDFATTRGAGVRDSSASRAGVASGANTAVPRIGSSSGANAAVPRTNSWLPPSGGRSTDTGSSETPRYVNRGDEIVRSQTERPTPPRQASPRDVAPQSGFPMRDGYAGPRRTTPAGAARPVDPRVESRDPRMSQPRAFEPRAGLPSDGARDRPLDGARDRPGRVDGRSTDSPVYRPQYEARPRGPAGYEPPQRQSDPSVRQAPPSASPNGREAQGRAEPMRPAPSERRPSGGYVEGRQAPPDRAAPRSAPRETAAPRDAGRPAPSGGAATRRGGGRGGQ